MKRVHSRSSCREADYCAPNARAEGNYLSECSFVMIIIIREVSNRSSGFPEVTPNDSRRKRTSLFVALTNNTNNVYGRPAEYRLAQMGLGKYLTREAAKLPDQISTSDKGPRGSLYPKNG